MHVSWKHFQEEEEWEKVRQIDNPILPWSVKYAPDVGAHNMGHGRPHFYTVSKTRKPDSRRATTSLPIDNMMWWDWRGLIHDAKRNIVDGECDR